MKKLIAIITLLLAVCTTRAQRTDTELSRDSILDWRYLLNAPKQQTYKPIKDQYVPGVSYSVWQQQAADMLFNWVKQSVLPKGVVMKYVFKDNSRWWPFETPALHTYGIQLAGFPAIYKNGKLYTDGEHGLYMGLGFNNFPGDYIKGGFNPDGLYLFAERAQLSTGDTDDQLKSEGIDKRILPQLYTYRTYLDHYHDNGKPLNGIGVVIAKNGEWPFKPVLVKDAVKYINQQLAAYPGIAQKNSYVMRTLQQTLDRLKSYYNEATKLKEQYAMLEDEAGHAVLNPESIINGLPVSKTFPEYRVLVAATKQTIDQSKTDKPMWLYMNFSGNGSMVGNLSQFDPQFTSGRDYFVNTLLRNFNFDYAAKWLSQPEAMKSVAYTPVNAPAKSSGNNISAPATVSAATATKNKDPFTILYEDFEGHQPGAFSAKGWHTYGHNGHDFANATLKTLNGQQGKWIIIPNDFTFYPDFTKPLPASFSISYDVYFSSDMSNKRTPVIFRLDTYDNKKYNSIDLHDMNRNGFQFNLAPSGESQTSKRFMEVAYNETLTDVRLTNIKTNEATHVSININGAAVKVTVNGKEVMHDDNVLPAGKTFKRYGWYSGSEKIYISNIYVKSGTPVK
ncbi:MAG: hypothetical protein E6Q24_03455 [Chitinophagaceae bacterium]|nr:MAG: hypothetical protein E6Q24_03455 [Chitinophagaceae bacterium]